MALPLTDPARSTLLRLSGRDALDVLHRISTQTLLDLEPSRARATLFCDFRGRLLHRAIVARAGDSVWLLRDDAPVDTLLAWVDRHVFREDVRMESSDGANASTTLVHGGELVPGSVIERDGVPVRVQVSESMALVIGDVSGFAPTTELDRIMAGHPRHGHEIAEAFTPYEIGLAREVHLSKGCYTGQEVLLRLMTYESVRRRLVRVRGTGVTPVTPSPIATSGVLTSATQDAGGWIGLAVVANAASEPGATLAIGDASATIEHAFPVERPPGLP